MHLHVKTAGTYVCLRNGIDHNIKENDNLKYEKLEEGDICSFKCSCL